MCIRDRAGAALATILSQLASFCMLLLGCARGGNLRIRLKNVCFRRDLFLEIGKGGLPSCLLYTSPPPAPGP